MLALISGFNNYLGYMHAFKVRLELISPKGIRKCTKIPNFFFFYYLFEDKLHQQSLHDDSLLIYHIHHGRLFFTQPIVTLQTQEMDLIILLSRSSFKPEAHLN